MIPDLDARTCGLCSERVSCILADGSGYCRAHYDELWAWKQALDAEATREAGGPFSQTCPRRSEAPHVVESFPGPDHWEYGHGLITDERILGCSYCGSCHPDFFMEKVREGWVVGPTDKSYKAYLGKPLEGTDANHRQEALGGYEGPVGSDVAKFYFQHLSEEQRQEFIRLYNDKTMRVGYPGRFYSMPFFCRAAS